MSDIKNIKTTDRKPLFVLTGIVVAGNKAGRTVGMPTANLKAKEDISSLCHGVYAVVVGVGRQKYYGITHIGMRPSVDDSEKVTVETYIFRFDKDLYGKEMTIFAHKYILPTIAFDSLEDVKSQVDTDISEAKAFFGI